MEPKPVPVSAFAKVLRSFQTGGVSYNDFMSQVNQQLAAGASPTDMLDTLRRRESVEPLPAYVHTALFGLLSSRRHGPAAAEPPPSAEAYVDVSAVIAGAVAAARKRHAARTEKIPPPPESAPLVLEKSEPADGAGRAADCAGRAGNGAAPRGSAAVGGVLANRFALLELIGVGAMSRVFKATDATDPGEPHAFIAIKVLTRPLNEESGSFSEFQKEVEKLKGLSHPNIVRAFECGRDDSTVFITMEYLVGSSLFARRRAAAESAAAPREDAHAIVTAVASALEYAHANDVVHGDLKPGNVIITHGGEIKLIDFGMAWWFDRPKTALERREAVKGTFADGVTGRYASPQLMARHKPTVVDDVYGLACLAYEVFTGIHPYDDGKGAQTPRFPPPMRPGLTAAQYTAMVNALQLEPRKRTPTVREFMDQLAAPPPRTRWKKTAAWVSGAILAVLAGWFIGRPANKVDVRPPVAEPPPVPSLRVPAPAPPAAAAPPRTVIRDCPTCPPMTELPTGRYAEGSPEEDAEALASEKPQHAVTISAPLAMSTNAVTVADFRQFVAATGRKVEGCDVYEGTWRRQPKAGWNDPGFAQTDTHPVTCVSWNDATSYARWLSGKTRHVYRLPSAAEWEYAARAGGAAARPWGANAANACAYANVADQTAAGQYSGWNVFACSDSFVNTAPVGSFKANAFGLNDMLGNVFVWTQDCWHRDYTGAPSDGTARMDGNCREHELRGGSWFSSPAFVRAPYRDHFAADYRTSNVGIRLVREISP